MDIDRKTSRQYVIHPWKTMMGVFLISVIVLFATLTLLFMNGKELSQYFEYTFPIWGWVGILVLATSSFTFEMARKKLQVNQFAQSAKFLALTIVLGLLFISTQFGFFADLYSQNIIATPQNSRPGYLYILTGLHGAHVVAGILVLYFANRAVRKRPTAHKTTLTLSVGGFFWHFLGALWLYLVLVMFIMR